MNGDNHGERRREYPALIERLTRLEEKLISSEKALELATRHMSERLHVMNEFRVDMQRLEKSFITRDSFDIKHEIIQKQVDDLRMTNAELRGKASMASVYFAYLFSAVSIIIALLHLVR